MYTIIKRDQWCYFCRQFVAGMIACTSRRLALLYVVTTTHCLAVTQRYVTHQRRGDDKTRPRYTSEAAPISRAHENRFTELPNATVGRASGAVASLCGDNALWCRAQTLIQVSSFMAESFVQPASSVTSRLAAVHVGNTNALAPGFYIIDQRQIFSYRYCIHWKWSAICAGAYTEV